jgi:hypothetical protein
MWTAGNDGNPLEDVFSILRFRPLGVVSFRKFYILCARPGFDASALQVAEVATQPLPIHR